MIVIESVSKSFENYDALSDVSISVSPGNVYGLVGTNGAGKSTLLRTICGIYSPKSGRVLMDNENIFDNARLKSKIVLVPDDLYFLSGSTLGDMAQLYRDAYPQWNEDKYLRLCKTFPLNVKAKLNTFSKGMKRQAAIILALARNPEYLLLDEAFDGLDPVIRVAVRKLIYEEVAERSMSVIISSHNLRELEDICDHIMILHAGKVLLERELDDLKTSYCKVQMAFRPEYDKLDFDGMDVLKCEKQGSIIHLLIKGAEADIIPRLEAMNPVIMDCVPLTLEEVFINEMEAVGYDYNHVIF